MNTIIAFSFIIVSILAVGLEVRFIKIQRDLEYYQESLRRCFVQASDIILADITDSPEPYVDVCGRRIWASVECGGFLKIINIGSPYSRDFDGYNLLSMALENRSIEKGGLYHGKSEDEDRIWILLHLHDILRSIQYKVQAKNQDHLQWERLHNMGYTE